MSANVDTDVAALHPTRMGLGPQPLAEWLAARPGDAAILAERAELIDRKRGDVIAALPEGGDAVSELARALADHGRCGPLAGDAAAVMAALGRGFAEDICVSTAADGGYRLSAAALCFPNRWRLSDKLGRSSTAIHRPVPDYEAALAGAVDRFLERLRPMRLFVRENWGFAARPDRHLPDPIPPVNAAQPGAAFLRTEEQSFVKLPASGAVIFSIRTTIVPWKDVPEDRQSALLAAVDTLTAAWLTYKSITRR